MNGLMDGLMNIWKILTITEEICVMYATFICGMHSVVDQDQLDTDPFNPNPCREGGGGTLAK